MTARGEVFDRLWAVLQLLGRDVGAASGEHGLTPVQGMLLDQLTGGGPVPMSELARRLHCDKSNLTGLVDALEARGLVERTTPTEDRRVRALVATERGAAVRAVLSGRLRDHNPLLDRLSDADADHLLRLLRRLG